MQYKESFRRICYISLFGLLVQRFQSITFLSSIRFFDYSAHLISGLAIILRLMRSPSHKLVYGQHNLTEFAPTDATISIQIV